MDAKRKWQCLIKDVAKLHIDSTSSSHLVHRSLQEKFKEEKRTLLPNAGSLLFIISLKHCVDLHLKNRSNPMMMLLSIESRLLSLSVITVCYVSIYMCR